MINPFKKIAVFIPTLGRAHAIDRVIMNLQENTDKNLFVPYLVVELHDTDTINVANTLGVAYIVNREQPCYAGAINTAYNDTREPYFFMGADDLGFHPRWAEEALSHMTSKIHVVGTNDLGTIPIDDTTRNSTHYLVSRKYIKEQSGRMDERDTVLYPYIHNYTDTEFTNTAKVRGVYVYCPKSIVEHFHPVWGKGEWDETYKKGQRTSEEDRQTYQKRMHLWTK